jgi:hypothetical protein
MQQRHDWRTEEDKGRRDGHQEKMLQHVCREELLVQKRQGRANGQPNQADACQKTSRPPGGEKICRGQPKLPPSAKIENSNEEEPKCQGNRYSPGSQHGIGSFRHRGYCFGAVFGAWISSRAASRAGNCPGGCNVARNATSAVVSAGLRFFPYAGMLPPP